MTAIGTAEAKRILGIDYGTQRIGVAVSDPLLIIAQGVATFRNSEKFLSDLQSLIKRYDVGLIVVGMPYHRSGDRSQMAREVEQFIQKVGCKTGLEVVAWDEQYTSTLAQQTMVMMGVKKKKRQKKAKVDEIASALILQSFLDSRKS
ncbi:MAG: Holliday junction resolvase RuvX [Bacteroidota bacterium]